MYHIDREIAEQPEAIHRLLHEEADNITKIAAAIQEFNPTFVWIAARGTSDNAARYAQYLMSIQAGVAVGLATPSVHTLYGAQPDLSRALVIGISQSGKAADVRQVLLDGLKQGALTLAITNDANSPMAQTAQHHLYLHAGDEIAVAATKTYTTQLAAIAALVTAWTNNTQQQTQLSHLPHQLSETLKLSEAIPTWAERYRYMERIAVIGRGYNYATAFEISLKIKEMCRITGEEYSEADFRHGPIAVVERGFPVIVVAPQSKPLPLLIDLLESLRQRHAECLIISNAEQTWTYATKQLPLPDGLPEWLSPICAVLPGQVFARQLAQHKGYDVDKPEGLTKVTVTQ